MSGGGEISCHLLGEAAPHSPRVGCVLVFCIDRSFLPVDLQDVEVRGKSFASEVCHGADLDEG